MAEEEKTGKQKMKGMGLGIKLPVIMLALSLIPLIIISLVTYSRNNSEIQQNTDAFFTEIATGLGNQVNEWLEKNILAMKTMAQVPGMNSMDPARQEPIFASMKDQFPWMYLIFTLDTRGMNIARNDGQALKDYSDRSYYREIILGRDLSWETVIGKTSLKPALVLGVPIKAEGKLVGVFAAAMTLEDISKIVSPWKRGRTGFAFLMDEKSKVVAHPSNEYVSVQKNLNDHPLVKAYRQANEPVTTLFTDENGQQYGHIRSISHGWMLAIQQTEKEVFLNLRQWQVFALILLIITLVLVALFAWFAARSIVKPLRTLTAASEQMSLGDLNTRFDVSARDEIGLLAEAIQRMQTSLRMAIDRLRNR